MSLLLPFLTTVLAGIGAVVVRMFGPFAFIARSWFLLESNDPLLVLLLVFFMLSDRGHHVRAARIRRNVLIRSSEIPIATRNGISGHTAAEDCVFLVAVFFVKAGISGAMCGWTVRFIARTPRTHATFPATMRREIGSAPRHFAHISLNP